MGWHLYNNFLNPPEIAEVKDNNYHLENTDDGSGTVKLVLLRGKPKPHRAAEDSKFGVKSNYPVLQRKVEMYQYFMKDDKPMMGWRDHQEKDFTDKQGREWKNPPFPKDLKSLNFYQDFLLGDGDLPVSFDFLKSKLDMKKYSKNMYFLKNLPKECAVKGYEWKGNHYLKAGKNKNHIGDIRISYRVLNHRELPELTVIGQQTKGKVRNSNADCRLYDYAAPMDEIVKSYNQDAPHAALAAALFGTFFIVLGVFKGQR